MAAENRLEARINELETVKSDIETLITKYDAQEEEKFGGLVAIYEKMVTSRFLDGGCKDISLLII